jgi:hypothetical protein
MARDETVREPDAEPLLDRRAYLRLAGVAAASVAVAGASESVAAAGPSTPAGQTRPLGCGRTDRPDCSEDSRRRPENAATE